MTLEETVDTVMNIAFLPIAIFAMIFVLAMALYLPAASHNEKVCLEAGYPSARITWDFQGYCINIDGTEIVEAP